MMRARVGTPGRELARDLRVADRFLARLKGLLGRKALHPGEGLWITPCSGVHTFGMRFPIDVIFLDRAGRIVGLSKDLGPNRVSRLHPRASGALELPAGTIEATGSAPGDEVTFDSP